MAHSLDLSAADTVAHRGEVWTDARDYATVILPPRAEHMLQQVEYELLDLERPGTARVTGELKDGRFTIQTDEPHVKVAWRITGYRPTSQQPHPQQEES